LNQGLAKHQPQFFAEVKRAVRRKLPKAQVVTSENDGATGAALLARDLISKTL
jgi:hypothetical protein